MSTRNGKVAPFIDEERERLVQKTRDSFVSYVVMAFGWAGMTIALVGAAYLVYRYLAGDPDFKSSTMIAPLVILGLTYLVGWVVSLISIRALYNLIVPVVVKVYSFGVLAGILFVYARAIYKISIFQGQDPSLLPDFPKYFVVMMAGYVLLISLYLLVSNFVLIPHAIILLVAAFFHLVVAVYHYVFNAPTPEGLITYDVYFILTIFLIAFLVVQKGLYRPVKGTIASRFREKQR